MKNILITLFFITVFIFAGEPIKPIPLHIKYNYQKAKLGYMLFMDPNLSSSGKVSCATCHDLNRGGVDPRKTAVSAGVDGQKGSSNAPTVFNSYFGFRQFWNGKAKNLDTQAGGPLHNPVEMGMDNQKIQKYLRSNKFYVKEFKAIYHEKPTAKDVANAIAEFEKALFTPNCKFDKYLRGEIKLSKEEKKGYELFKTLGCIACHNGVDIGDNSYQKMGVIHPYKWQRNIPDRYAITHKRSDKNVFKVPTLRNILLTAPYFHDGSAKNIKEALNSMAYHNLGLKLTPDEIKALIAFFKTLTGQKPAILKRLSK